jgi:hypothetical protein
MDLKANRVGKRLLTLPDLMFPYIAMMKALRRHEPKAAATPEDLQDHSMMAKREEKITLGAMRASGVRGLLIYCSDYHCSHWIRVSAEQWSDQVRLSDLEDQFVCTACGKRGADVRPDFNPEKQSRRA